MSEIDTDADADAEPRTGAPAGPGRLVGRFPLSWDPVVGRAARLFGVTPDCAWVDINDGRLTARFGPWVTATDLANVASAEITGPYRWWKVAGPAHLSLRDLGLTYATTAAAGVCIRFRDPVRGIDPIGAIRHPSLTVTVADPEGLCDALGHVSTHVDAQRFDPTESVRQRLTQGAVAGAIATTAMSAAMLTLQRAGRSGKLSPRVITEKVVSPVRRAPEPVVRASAAAGHVAFGTAAGALFGVAAPRMPGPGWLRGVSFATGLMLLSYEGWVPAARILPSLHRQSTTRQASLVVAHLVYGTVLGRLAG